MFGHSQKLYTSSEPSQTKLNSNMGIESRKNKEICVCVCVCVRVLPTAGTNNTIFPKHTARTAALECTRGSWMGTPIYKSLNYLPGSDTLSHTNIASNLAHVCHVILYVFIFFLWNGFFFLLFQQWKSNVYSCLGGWSDSVDGERMVQQ